MKKKNPNWETVDENLQWERLVAKEMEPIIINEIKRPVATKIRRFNETKKEKEIN